MNSFNPKIKIMILIFLSILALLDMFTTFWGTNEILGGNDYSFLVSALFAVGISVFLIASVAIFDFKKQNQGMGNIVLSLWVIVLLYDAYTSWVGNIYLLFGEYTTFSLLETEQLFILVAFTIFTTTSGVFISYAIRK